MNNAKEKLLICGDVAGNFKQLFNRVESINKKSGPFEILLCVGDFFGQNNDELNAFKNGCKNVPIPTYILGPSSETNQKFYENIVDDICPNLTYLGKRGLYTLSSGIKIAYLSGIEGTGKAPFHFDLDDVTAVRNACLLGKASLSDYKGIDILLTSQWPAGYQDHMGNSSELISYLIKEIRPRYHFCGLNQSFFEPAPFRIQSDSTVTQLELSTRFIALAGIGNVKKEKYIYALNVTPVDKMRVLDLLQKTTNEVKCPFDLLNLTKYQMKVGKNVEKNDNQYFYDLSRSNSNTNDKRRKNDFETPNKRQRLIIDQDKCWFCLSSPNVEKHLVISIANSFYLALAKGPLNDYHILILTISHIPCASLLSNEEWKELGTIKKSLVEFFKTFDFETCFFERHYKTSHLQINAIGIQKNLAWKIKHSFEDIGEEHNIQLETIPQLTNPSDLPQQGPYFVAELPDDTTLLTRQMKKFPLHFAREVFCSENLFNCDEKIDWNKCTLSKEEEITIVENLRKGYQQFDKFQ